MLPTAGLSEQQVLTLYVIGTVLVVYPVVLVLVGLYGFLQRLTKSAA